MNRLIVLLCAFFAMAPPYSLSASADSRADDPGQFIQSVAADISDIVKARSDAERVDGMRQVLQRNFAMSYIAGATLGAHWNQASEPQRARILAAFEITEARAYADRLSGFSSIAVSNVTAKARDVWSVTSLLNLAGGRSVKIEWEVRRLDQELRISDIKVWGVSLFLTKGAEFQSYIRDHGGAVEPLVQVLEARAVR